MNHLKREFDGYLKAVYPVPPAPGSEQWEQLRSAFYAGALVVHTVGADVRQELLTDHLSNKAKAVVH